MALKDAMNVVARLISEASVSEALARATTKSATAR
jgi:hypothetical protein